MYLYKIKHLFVHFNILVSARIFQRLLQINELVTQSRRRCFGHHCFNRVTYLFILVHLWSINEPVHFA